MTPLCKFQVTALRVIADYLIAFPYVFLKTECLCVCLSVWVMVCSNGQQSSLQTDETWCVIKHTSFRPSHTFHCPARTICSIRCTDILQHPQIYQCVGGHLNGKMPSYHKMHLLFDVIVSIVTNVTWTATWTGDNLTLIIHELHLCYMRNLPKGNFSLALIKH